MAPYVYKPLTKPTRRDHAFRLLDILPCSAMDEPINVRLRHVRLEDKPQYECLSYSWGDMAQTHEVNIVSENDDDERVGSIKGRESLHGALARLHDNTKPRTIWADALCINQQDTDERSSQVSIMALVYWNSHKLAIWLGPDPDKQATAAFEALKPISQATCGKTLKLTNEDVDKFDPVV
ncbi:ankyrin and het domain protein [Colletotrichum chrysophilum]|uniref:Ankyrin and het domain protein n=1 Tax=Colletotrichum chrysophilum TaxID=1836956 RepID=A0AAD9A2L0_9PEZI|nr:ankyrin and het domain protein [Colletotrichum chrysophilum]